uniref:Uncharacterized protein n=1 Tax=Paramormyrops kingsleyae TaxID=1676925 RepID=A0A3B3RPB0_9TELE
MEDKMCTWLQTLLPRQPKRNSIANNYRITGHFQQITNSNENLIKVVKSEKQLLERDVACQAYAQDLKAPRHVLNDLIDKLELQKWLKSEMVGTMEYSELLTTLMMYTGNERIGCIGNPDQVIKWDHLMGYRIHDGTETLFITRICCHETSHYIICTCNMLQSFSHNDNKLINIRSLHGHADAVQVSHTQWCMISEMNSFTYGGLTCPANHSFCLEVTEDFTMGHINIVGRVTLETDVSPWWDDTVYEEGTRAMTKIMDLVQQVILKTEYHLHQAQVEANLAKKTAEILTSASTCSAQYVYTCGLIFIITLLQFCYLRHHVRTLKASTKGAFILSPVQVQTLQKLDP